MLAGEPPFPGPSAQAIAARVITGPPRPIRTVRPALPVHLERALAAGLAKSPADRPRTARTFVDALASPARERRVSARDRKSTRLNSSHGYISYAVFCLKKKKTS